MDQSCERMGKVKGILFVDYVRMARARKDVDWVSKLSEEDLRYLEEQIEPAAWYPMASFERFGLAILSSIMGDRLEMVRLWGRVTADALVEVTEGLVVPGDPRESLMRLFVQQSSFFDFETFRMGAVNDGGATIQIAYGMGPVAEEAASTQAEGFFVRLLELAGAHEVESSFAQASWRGDPRTTLALGWTA